MSKFITATFKQGDVELSIKGPSLSVETYLNVLNAQNVTRKTLSGPVAVQVPVTSGQKVELIVDASVAEEAKTLVLTRLRDARVDGQSYFAVEFNGERLGPTSGNSLTQSIPGLLYGREYVGVRRRDDVPHGRYYALDAWN